MTLLAEGFTHVSAIITSISGELRWRETLLNSVKENYSVRIGGTKIPVSINHFCLIVLSEFSLAVYINLFWDVSYTWEMFFSSSPQWMGRSPLTCDLLWETFRFHVFKSQMSCALFLLQLPSLQNKSGFRWLGEVPFANTLVLRTVLSQLQLVHKQINALCKGEDAPCIVSHKEDISSSK